MKPNAISLLHISDIHFGSSACSEDFALKDVPPRHRISGAIPMKSSLIKALANSGLAALIASGDLTSTGSPSEFDQCSKTLLEIAEALHVKPDAVFLTFGNHDVDWRISSLTRDTGKTEDPLYATLAGHVGDVFVHNPSPSSRGPLPGCAKYERQDFVLFVANSGFYCSHDQSYRHGVLGADQLNWLARAFSERRVDDSRWRILMLHHHPQKYSFPTPTEDISCLQEGSELLDIIGKGNIDFVCHGHRHHPYLCTIMQNGWNAPVTFLCAGSLAVNDVDRRLGEIPNLCHVVNLQSRGPQGGAVGDVRTFRYVTSKGWDPVTYSREVPLDPCQRFGSIASEVQLRSQIEQIIHSLISKDASQPVDLPAFDSLPFDLLCRPTDSLNLLIRDVAMNSFSRRVIGRYPEDPVILRK